MHIIYRPSYKNVLKWNHNFFLLLLLLRWRYSPGWTLASFTIRLQASRSLALSVHSFIPIFLRSRQDTSSSHLIFGLPLHLIAYSFPYIFFGIAVLCILSIWPNHRILWHFINLTMLSPFIIASSAYFRRISIIRFLSVFHIFSAVFSFQILSMLFPLHRPPLPPGNAPGTHSC